MYKTELPLMVSPIHRIKKVISVSLFSLYLSFYVSVCTELWPSNRFFISCDPVFSLESGLYLFSVRAPRTGPGMYKVGLKTLRTLVLQHYGCCWSAGIRELLLSIDFVFANWRKLMTAQK